MSDILIGMDAGASMIKCAALSTSGELLASRSRTNRYDTSPRYRVGFCAICPISK